MSINKKRFVDDLAERTGFPKYKAKIFYEAFENLMREYLLQGEKVKIHELFTAEVKEYKGYSGTNPRTHEPMEIPAFRKVKISASRKLNDILKDEC